MSTIHCSCLKRNGEICKKAVKYKYEFTTDSHEKHVRYSCKLMFHKRYIVSELNNDSRVAIYCKHQDTFNLEYNDLTCSQCVILFDTLFHQPHTKKQTLYKKYCTLQNIYYSELEHFEIVYPRTEVEEYYRDINRLEIEVSMIMTPYTEKGDYGEYENELSLQNAVNDRNIRLLEKIDYIKKYEMSFYLNIMKSRDRFITAKEEYVSEFYEVKLLHVNNREKECSICMIDINKENGGYLKCGHCFHNDCLGKWIKCKRTDCPMCRQHFNKLDVMKNLS